jgi:dipeptidyl aminopeptidase
LTELTNWLINAFNGEWLKITDAKPNEARKRSLEEIRKRSGISVSGGQTLPLSLLSGLAN